MSVISEIKEIAGILQKADYNAPHCQDKLFKILVRSPFNECICLGLSRARMRLFTLDKLNTTISYY